MVFILTTYKLLALTAATLLGLVSKAKQIPAIRANISLRETSTRA
jgi:hypothetical protein